MSLLLFLGPMCSSKHALPVIPHCTHLQPIEGTYKNVPFPARLGNDELVLLAEIGPLIARAAL